ncbi:SAF domain-containing protein [Paenibacillus sp. N1-5-1-14]|uniref:SAF domain-containing protein n=1 Tax=Paenibacillus radicibacter TaxID=2972488 RepID=UPI0021590762|nr:SAF domain-containing protein [Paenibacillus radicibacter]MCR8642106.1 SAF domain-containing protein [Paenibacillus radicibacter]
MSVIRQRTKNLIVAGMIGALSMGLVGAGVVTYNWLDNAKETKRLQDEYEKKIKAAELAQQQKAAVKQSVVIANKELPAGTTLTSEDVTILEVDEQHAPVNAIASNDLAVGKVLKISVSDRTPIIAPMLFEEGPVKRDIRSQEFNVITLPSKLKKDDFVDVRINFPTGQDYIVLSKKKVKDLALNTVWYDMNEVEILNFSSAIVDAYLQGGKIYALSYVDPYMQEAAITNYPANLKVLELLRTDPNVLERAKDELVKRMRQKLEKDLSEMDEAQKSRVLSGRAQHETQAQNQVQTQSQSQTQNPNQGSDPSQNQNPKPNQSRLETAPSNQGGNAREGLPLSPGPVGVQDSQERQETIMNESDTSRLNP